MENSVKVKFCGKMLFSFVVPGLVLLALMVSVPCAAGAAGDSAGDAKVQAMRTDTMACMQPGDAGKKAREAFAKKYNVPLSKVNENVPGTPPAGNGGWSKTAAQWVCGLEIVSTACAGAALWAERGSLDSYKNPYEWGALKFGYAYCIEYSMNCDHYAWTKGCLKAHVPGCCE